VLKALREDDAYRDMKVIMLTARARRTATSTPASRSAPTTP
jgi:hypothetical protein